MDHHLLRGIPLLQGIDANDIQTVLNCVDAFTTRYAKNDYIHHRGDRVRQLGVVITGRISIEREDIWGNRRVLELLGPGSLLAESHAGFPDEILTVNIRAEQDCMIMYLDLNRILSVCSSVCAHHTRLLHNYVAILAEKNRSLNSKINLLTRRTLRERILTYLDEESRRQESSHIIVPLTRQQMAEYLSADRSALSSELSRMQQEGLIHYTRNYFELLTADPQQ